jgi:sporulation protein YlmC with PRC-barrel domain
MVDTDHNLCYHTNMQKGTNVYVTWADRVGTVRNIRLDDANEAIITVEFDDGELIVARPSELRKE